MVIVAQLPVSIAKAFCPGHLTGFFATDKSVQMTHPNFNGSLGAGFSISKGIYTTVKVYNDFSKNYKIIINGVNSFDARVSKFVIEYYLKMIDKPVFVSVDHESEIPIGYGLGSSGSAALSLSYALNQALKTNLSKIHAAQVAHHADFICKTGLGHCNIRVYWRFRNTNQYRRSWNRKNIKNSHFIKIPCYSFLYKANQYFTFIKQILIL